MGNCLRQKRSSWEADDDDDDWESLVSIHRESEGDRLLDDHGNTSREVKITISRKELERLVQKMDMQGLSLEQALVHMVNRGGDVYEVEEEQPRPWKPVLQSIPEVD